MASGSSLLVITSTRPFSEEQDILKHVNLKDGTFIKVNIYVKILWQITSNSPQLMKAERTNAR